MLEGEFDSFPGTHLAKAIRLALSLHVVNFLDQNIKIKILYLYQKFATPFIMVAVARPQ